MYYMCTKWFADGDVHKYFSPYDTPYDAFVTWMNVAQDFGQRLALEARDAEAPTAGALAGVG
jgi:alpha-amylase